MKNPTKINRALAQDIFTQAAIADQSFSRIRSAHYELAMALCNNEAKGFVAVKKRRLCARYRALAFSSMKAISNLDSLELQRSEVGSDATH